MKTRSKRRAMLFAVVAAALTAAALVVLPAAATANSPRLDAQLGVVNAGPLPACSEDGSDCTAANIVRYYIYVENDNRLENLGGARRADIRNAFVIDRIDQAVFVDGVQAHQFDFTYTPPPNPSYRPYSGHWPATASCPPEGPPCNIVGRPAILPGEKSVGFWVGWAHGDQEPNGRYVFTFTIHGTLNGTPVDLQASSPWILMTS